MSEFTYKEGVRGFSVVNHMLLPKAFQPTVEKESFSY
jgi:hypothetical protein